MNNTNKSTGKTSRFPFDCIVVTSPDEASAESAKVPLKRLLHDRLIHDYPEQVIRIVSTYDSFGARCGSGGGTLAALECAAKANDHSGSDDKNGDCSVVETILVLHAGGDSSRCPTQMILGKAWTSLSCSRYPNPITWLIHQIQQLFQTAQFPQGTVVVAATDTLLTFFEASSGNVEDHVDDEANTIHWDFQQHPQDGEPLVLGIAVPAVVETATNHGVYVLSNETTKTKGLTVTDPLHVWQKPSVTQLTTSHFPEQAGGAPASACFDSDDGQQCAWIDTGVIVFLPKAVQVLNELSQGILSMCTRAGIQGAYDKMRGTSTDISTATFKTVEEFAKEHARNVDLYTEIMHNLSWPSRVTSDEEGEANPLQVTLSKVSLKILAVPQGRFLHLGTTKELVKFVTTEAYSHGSNSALSSDLSLRPRHQCWTEARPLNHNVAIHSTFPSDAVIGRGSLLEYCDLDGYDSVVVGSNCMLSGWRNPCFDTTALRIPDNITVQMLALKHKGGVSTSDYVYMVLGTFDGVKADRSTATMYGRSIPEFLECTGMTTTDLGWNDSLGSMNCNLWNAKLHIRVPQSVSFESAYNWLDKLWVGDSVKEDPSFKLWLSFPRFSLRELHDIVDAEMEWTFRLEQEAKVCQVMRTNVVPHLQQLLRDRQNDSPCDLEWIVEMPDVREGKYLVLQILNALEDLAVAELANNNFDMVGRAFMIASALLSDFADRHFRRSQDSVENPGRSDEIISFCSSLILRIRSLSLQQSPVNEAITYLVKIVEYRRSVFDESSFENTRAVSEVMERLSFCMNELSIGWGYTKFLHYADDGRAMLVRKTSPVLNNQWVESSSPVRVDLAGGWSDTPPICYEFGGTVTGIAVRVDSQKPLSCRCRLVHGQKGILLRSENRSSRDGSLVHAVEVNIDDSAGLADFRNPMSDCALLKAALICLCLVSEEELCSKTPLQTQINHFCSSGEEDVRLEIISTSILPQGSGMGTSSILAATVLACISKCVGYGDLDEDYLLHGVLMLEQLLTSGGGWQDQAHGIIPGIKTVSSAPSKLPVTLKVEQIPLSKSLKDEIDCRLILVFTGMTRLARNILQDVLRRWSRRTDEVVKTVARNVTLAEQCRDALVAGDVDKVGTILTDYSTIKVQGMAGESSGALPKSCKTFISSLLDTKMIQGASLCGAGGGGFMVLILSKDRTMEQVADFVRTELVPTHLDFSEFTFHSCHICDEGLTTLVHEEG